jgi:2-polyprenyl-3-methyl-5-hydroxy-6-metoxy-1,4-benzoquinol methylase
VEENIYLTEYYNRGYEDGRLRGRYGSIEFLTTERYILKYIKPGDKIIEIGAGTGRYSHAFAKRGYTVDAVELVRRNIEIFKQNTEPGENVTITQSNALDLSAFEDNSYNITLLLGPLYHLYTKQDKITALREAIRVTKPGGVVFAAYLITDGAIFNSVKRGTFSIKEFIEKGLINDKTFAARSEPSLVFELVRKEDIDELMEGLPAKRLHYVMADESSRHMREEIDAMDDESFELYLKYHFAICERQDMTGMTDHALDIFRKR